MKAEFRENATRSLGAAGLDISIYDDCFLERSIERRIAVAGANSESAYLELLEKDRGEAMALFDSLHVGFSEFFRNPLSFACLERIVLPALAERKKAGDDRELRIWSAACAEGQEAYSAAILCDELLSTADSGLSCRIFATDIDERALAAAAAGVYDSAALGNVSLKRLTAYFSKKADAFALVPRIRGSVEFSVFDLLTNGGTCPPMSIYGDFDIVFCGNLLFYYKPERRKRILERIINCLAPGGYLVTGEAEREIVARHHFREAFPASAVFRIGGAGGTR